MRIVSAMILSAALLSGCGAFGGIERSNRESLLSRYEPYVGAPIDSFTALRTDSWQPISRTQLVLWTTMNDAYLLTVANNCPELPFANRVGVTSSTSTISRLDAVLVRGDRCPIVQIQPIDVRQMRADRHARAREDA